jgi:hypothetical protein
MRQDCVPASWPGSARKFPFTSAVNTKLSACKGKERSVRPCGDTDNGITYNKHQTAEQQQRRRRRPVPNTSLSSIQLANIARPSRRRESMKLTKGSAGRSINVNDASLGLLFGAFGLLFSGTIVHVAQHPGKSHRAK